MKRLLPVLLICVTISAADAAPFRLEGGWPLLPETPMAVTVISEDASSWLGYLIVDAGSTGALDEPVVLPAAGDLAAALEYAEEHWGAGYELTVAASPEGNIKAGRQFTFKYSYMGPLLHPTTISLFVDPEYEVPAARLYIPEPISVALLGLGGLFLRRRR